MPYPTENPMESCTAKRKDGCRKWRPAPELTKSTDWLHIPDIEDIIFLQAQVW